MSSHTKIDFGWVVQPVPRSLEGRPTLLADNQKFLELIRYKFQTAWLEDHFQWNDRDTLEGWTHLAYLMPHFPELRFGTLVLGQAYRSPALLAKMAATLHALSGGRFILGIGAGWKEDEYRAYGWPFPSPGRRVRELEEYAAIIKAKWAHSPATFTGKYYSIKDAYCEPRPNPMIPLMIGGNGEKGTLKVTAQYADWWNFPLRTAELFGQKVNVLKQHCDAIGRDINDITLTAFEFVSLSNDPAKVVRPSQMHHVAGNPDEVTRELEQFVQAGARHFMLRFVDFPRTEGIELFMEKVLPRFR